MTDVERFDVFVAYAGPDEAWVGVLAGRLREAGLRVFFDKWVILPGDVVTHRREEGIEAATAGVVVCSTWSVSSARVMDQYAALHEQASRVGSRLVPVLYEDVRLPPFLAIREPVDFRHAVGDVYESRVVQLIAAIRQSTAEQAQPAARVTPNALAALAALPRPRYLPAELNLGRVNRPRWVVELRPPPGEQPKRKPWSEASARRLVVLLGHAGMGKTWLMRSHVQQICRDGGETGAGAALLRCDQLVQTAGDDFTTAVALVLRARGIVDAIPDLLRQGQLTVVLDAFDELPGDQARARFEHLLDTVPASVRCVVAGRLAGYTGPPGRSSDWHELLLEPLDEADVHEVIAAWPLPADRRASLRRWARNSGLAGMTRIPMLLMLLCSLAQDEEIEHLPTIPAYLYERVLRRFLVHEQRPPASSDTDVDRLLDILTPIAYRFAADPDGRIDLMARRPLIEAIRAADAFREWALDAPSVLKILSREAGVLVPAGDPTGGRGQPYLFVHRAFAEFLTARAVAALAVPDLVDILRQRLTDPVWRDTLDLVAAQRVAHAGRSAAVDWIRTLLTWAPPAETIAELDIARQELETAVAAFERAAAKGQEISDDLLAEYSRRDNVVGSLRERAYSGMALAAAVALRAIGDLTAAGVALPEELVAEVGDRLITERRERRLQYADWIHAVAASPVLPDRLIEQIVVLAGSQSQDLLRALAHHQQPQVTDLLVRVAREDNSFGAGAALEALTFRPGATALDALLRAFWRADWPIYTPEWGVPHETAVEALRRRQDPAALPILREILAGDPPGAQDIINQRIHAGALRVLEGYTDSANAVLNNDPNWPR